MEHIQFIDGPLYDMEQATKKMWKLPQQSYTWKQLGATSQKEFNAKRKSVEMIRYAKAVLNFLDGEEYEGKTDNSYLKLSISKKLILACGKYESCETMFPIAILEENPNSYRLATKDDWELIDKIKQEEKEIMEKENSIKEE